MLGYKETTPSRACWSSSVRGFFSLPSISPTQNHAYPINIRGAAERQCCRERSSGCGVIFDRDDQQLYLDDGMRRWAYWIVVTNSKRRSERVLRIAQGRGNQENLIKDCKYGLGLAHVPTGSLAANQAYFVIAGLAWNLKTWMLNLLGLST